MSQEHGTISPQVGTCTWNALIGDWSFSHQFKLRLINCSISFWTVKRVDWVLYSESRFHILHMLLSKTLLDCIHSFQGIWLWDDASYFLFLFRSVHHGGSQVDDIGSMKTGVWGICVISKGALSTTSDESWCFIISPHGIVSWNSEIVISMRWRHDIVNSWLSAHMVCFHRLLGQMLIRVWRAMRSVKDDVQVSLIPLTLVLIAPRSILVVDWDKVLISHWGWMLDERHSVLEYLLHFLIITYFWMIFISILIVHQSNTRVMLFTFCL